MIDNTGDRKESILEKVKVIHVITRCDQGGSAEDTLVLVNGHDTERYDVFLVKGLSKESAMNPDEYRVVADALQNARRRGVRVIDFPSLVRRISPVNDFKALWQLFLFFRREKPTIVHTHTSKTGLLGRWAAFWARVPIIIHTPHGHVFHGYFNSFVSLVFKYMEIITTAITDKIIAVSDQEKRDYLQHRVGSDERIIPIYSAVNLKRFIDLDVDIQAKKEELGIPRNYNVVGTVGRLVTIKGPEFLVKAAQKVVEQIPETVFVFVGDGDLHEELEKLADDLGIRENILFAGWHRDVAEILYTFDVFVLPSLNEGMGKVLVEAMAAGKPIVASDVGGIVDLVKNNKNGFLVPPKDVEGLAKHIATILQDKKLAKRLGDYGKEMVYPKFDVSMRIEKVEQLYEDLIREKFA